MCNEKVSHDEDPLCIRVPKQRFDYCDFSTGRQGYTSQNSSEPFQFNESGRGSSAVWPREIRLKFGQIRPLDTSKGEIKSRCPLKPSQYTAFRLAKLKQGDCVNRSAWKPTSFPERT